MTQNEFPAKYMLGVFKDAEVTIWISSDDSIMRHEIKTENNLTMPLGNILLPNLLDTDLG